MAKNLDLTLLPLYRLSGNELPSPPGLLAVTPPRRPARGRDKDRLIVHLTLGGNAAFSTAIYLQSTSVASEEFYKTPGSVTAALRASAIALNGDLLERNMELSGQGRYSVGHLILCALRGSQLYVLEAGPTHVYWMADNEREHVHDPSLSGRGLGMGQATNVYLSQLPVRAGGRLLLSPKLPSSWEPILQRDNYTAPLEIMRTALMRQSTEDENAVLIDVSAGRGLMDVLKPQRQPQPSLEIITKRLKEEPKLPETPPPTPLSHQPAPLPVEPATAQEEEEKTAQPPVEQDVMVSIPRQTPMINQIADDPEEKAVVAFSPEAEKEVPVKKEVLALHETPDTEVPTESDPFASIPRRAPDGAKEKSVETSRPDSGSSTPVGRDVPESIPRSGPEPINAHPLEQDDEDIPSGPSKSEVIARQSARTLAKGMQATRAGNKKLQAGFEKMLPRLLPSDDEGTPVRLPTWVMGLIAVIIPLIVVTVSTLVYLRLGNDSRYEEHMIQAQEARAEAQRQDDVLAQRLAWEEVMAYVELAEERKATEETRILREEAQAQIDLLLDIYRLGFKPAITGLPSGIRITRIEANDSELFMLDEGNGTVLRAYLVGEGYQHDSAFICKAGDYSGTTIRNLVEIQILPKSNAMGASVLAFDAQGGMLYCAGNKTPQALTLSSPSVGFRDITAVALQSDVLYVLDAPSREVWVYGGQASTFINYPTAFFSTEAPERMEFAVDMSVNDTDLYLLFSDGHLATCTYSLLDSVPTRCVDPVPLVDTNPAAGGGNLFGNALFTEVHISNPPDAALLLLAGESQSIFRFSPRSYELQNQIKARGEADGALPTFALTAITTNANHTLFIAQDDQVYMVDDAP